MRLLETLILRGFRELYSKESPGQRHLWDEDAHPRNADGEFAPKGEGEQSKPDEDTVLDHAAEAPGFALERETVPKAPEPPAAYREYTEMMGKAGLEPRPFDQWDKDRTATLAKQEARAKDAPSARETADPLQGKYDEYRSMMQGAKLTPRPFDDWKKGLKPAAEPGKISTEEPPRRTQAELAVLAAKNMPAKEIAEVRKAAAMTKDEYVKHISDIWEEYPGYETERDRKQQVRMMAMAAATNHDFYKQVAEHLPPEGITQQLKEKSEAPAKSDYPKGKEKPSAEEIELAGGPDSIGHDTLKLLAGHSKASYGSREFVADIRKKAGERFAGFDAMVKELEEKAGDNSTLREMLAEARPRRDIIARVLAHHDADPSISLQAPPPAAELKERAKADEDQQARNLKWDGAKHAKTAAKLREMADSMAEAADADLGRDRLTNTHKRAREAGHAIKDAYRRQAEANTLRNIADHLEGGNAEHLRGVKNRAQVEALDTALRRGFNDRTRNNYAEYERDKEGHRTEADAQAAKFPFPFVHKDHVKNIAEAIRGKPGTAKAIARATRLVAGTEYGAKAETQADIDALDELIGLGEHFGTGHSATHAVRMLKDERKEYNRLVSAGITPENFHAALEEYRQLKSYGEREPAWKKLERGLIGRKIPGFFPTPKTVIGKMLDRAKIEPGMSVLEPSAGKGDILDALKSRHPEAQAKALEISGDLRAVIEGKGHTVAGDDFIEHGEKYDRVIGNPPFENHQDIDHLRHAYSLLKPGGRVVFVMSSGPFFREQNKDREFRGWFDSVGGEVEDLPQGSFSGSDAFRQTGVSTKLVTIDKPQ